MRLAGQVATLSPESFHSGLDVKSSPQMLMVLGKIMSLNAGKELGQHHKAGMTLGRLRCHSLA